MNSRRSRCTRRRLATVAAGALLAGAAPLPGGLLAAANAAAPCPAVVAHRGNVGAPENSTKAFSNAVAVGARIVEMDVRFTKASEAVLMHDSTVDRTTNGSGGVSNMSYAKFSSLRLNTGPNAATLNLAPPTMSAALQAAQGATTYLVELKVTPREAQLRSLIEELRALGIASSTVISSFSETRIRQVQSAYPEQRTALIGNADEQPDPATVRSLGDSYHGHRATLTPEYVQKLHGAGVKVYGWTANTPESWTALRDAGVDGAITDRTSDYLAWSRPEAGNCA